MIKSSHSLKLFPSTFKDIISALLAKISWMIAVNEGILCTKNPQGRIWLFWILAKRKGVEEFHMGLEKVINLRRCFVVGDGKTTKVNHCYFLNWLLFFLLLLLMLFWVFLCLFVILSIWINSFFFIGALIILLWAWPNNLKRFFLVYWYLFFHQKRIF